MAVAGGLPGERGGGKLPWHKDFAIEATLTGIVIARHAIDTDVEIDLGEAIKPQLLKRQPAGLGVCRTDRGVFILSVELRRRRRRDTASLLWQQRPRCGHGNVTTVSECLSGSSSASRFASENGRDVESAWRLA